MDNVVKIFICAIIINCQLLIINFSASAQRFDYKDRNEGDTVIVSKKTYIIHKVKKDETVFTIAAKYHVSVNDLDNANKDVINNLKKNTTLLIPVAVKKTEIKKEEVKEISHKEQVYKIAFLIPLNENKNYTADSTLANGYSLNAELEKETVSSLEFYEGIMIAIDSLRKNGLKAHITVVDAYDSTSVNAAKLKTEVKNADMIITNLNQNLSALLSNYSVNGKPVIVSCGTNSSASLKKDSSAWFTSPSSLLQCQQMGGYYANTNKSENRFIITKTAFSRESERAAAYDILLTLDVNEGMDMPFLDTTKEKLCTLLDTTKEKLNKLSLAGHMVKGKNNIVILPSTNEAFVSDVITYLKALTSEFKITLSGLPTWQHFESVNPEDLQMLHTEIFSAVNIAYQSAPVMAFRKTFMNNYATEPSENAFAGYDAMMFFGDQLLSHGDAFGEYAVNIPGVTGADKNYSGLSTVYHFNKYGKAPNGFENDHIFVLRFENYSLKTVNR